VTRVDVAILVLAAGRGVRLGRGDKAFVVLRGKTLLERAVATCRPFGPIAVAVPPGRVDEATAVCPPGTTVIEGAETRAASLRRLLGVASAPLVMIHDVAHPLASPALFRAVLAAAKDADGAIAALRPTDFVYRDGSTQEVDGRPAIAERVSGAWVAQSPKAFRRELLNAGYALADERRAIEAAWEDPGSLELVQLAGGRVITVPGEARNLKITDAEDLPLAEALLSLDVSEDQPRGPNESV